MLPTSFIFSNTVSELVAEILGIPREPKTRKGHGLVLSGESRPVSEASVLAAKDLLPPPPPPPPSLSVLKIRAVENSEFKALSFKDPTNVFERKAKNFIKDEPEMLFISEYTVDDNCIGALVCWENHYDATHYEVFKRNVFKSESEFERILFLDVNSLKQERENFAGYIRNTLGIKAFLQGYGGGFSNAFVMLDDQLKEDRIYEYKVRASRVPQEAKEIDYDLILDSKGLLLFNSSGAITLNTTIFRVSEGGYGSRDLAWVIPLVNENMIFFGREPTEQPIREVARLITESDRELLGMSPGSSLGNKRIFFKPKNINDIMCLYQQSLSLFGVEHTFRHLIRTLGGLPVEFLYGIIKSLDKSAGTFSYDNYKQAITEFSPVFGLALEVSESAEFDPKAVEELSQMSISIPIEEGSENITELLGLTRVLKFINDTLIALLNSQDNFEKIKEIRERVQKAREDAGEDVVDEAIGEDRDSILDLKDPNLQDLYQVRAGTTVNVVARDGDRVIAETTPPSTKTEAKGATTVKVEQLADRGITIL